MGAKREKSLAVEFYGDGAIHVRGVSAVYGGGKRGEIRGFSKASRLRLWRLLASLDFEDISRGFNVYFVTLTIQADAWEEKQDMRGLKRALNTFWVLLKKKLGEEMGAIWKLEFTKRGVAHVHFLLVTREGFKNLKPWISKTWPRVFMKALSFERGDERIERMFRASTNIERVSGVENLLAYLGKYTAKTVENVEGWTGRMWGVVNKAFLKQFERVEVVQLDNLNVFWRVRRLCRKWVEKRTGRKYTTKWGGLSGLWVFFVTKSFKQDFKRFLMQELQRA